MGSKQILLAILVLILLSSTAVAVDFEWVLADKDTRDVYGRWNPAGQNEHYETFLHTMSPAAQEPRILVAQLWYHGRDVECNRCRIGIKTGITYEGLTKEYCKSVGGSPDDVHGWIPFFNIADKVFFGGCKDWRMYCCGSCTHRCDVDYDFDAEYYQVAVSGFDSVFVRDQTKSLGTVKQLMGDFPENGSIVMGLNSYFRDALPQDNYVLSWFGSCDDPDQDYPGDINAKYAEDENDCFLVCTDLNLNGHCDYTEDIVQRCFDNAGDWYAVGSYQACCAAITDERQEIPGILTRDSPTYEKGLNAICGSDDNGQYRWAPLDREGMVTNLLGSPGYTVLAENYPNASVCQPQGSTPEGFDVTSQYMPFGDWWGWMRQHWRPNDWDAFWGVGLPGVGTWKASNPGDLLHYLREYTGTSTNWAAVKLCRRLVDIGRLPGVTHDDITEGGTAYFYGGSEEWPNLYCPVRGPPIEEMDPLVSVKGALGTHEYICDDGSGYVFECSGEGSSYTDSLLNPVNVAEMGTSISDIVETGSCPPKIISYWTFDDGTADDGIDGWDGSLPSNQANQPASVAVGSGKGFEFDGTDVINLPDNFTIPDPGNKFSVETWIKLSNIVAESIIIEKENSFGLKVTGTPGTSQGKLKAAINTNGGLTYFGDGPVDIGVWYHVALVYNGADAELFINGESFGYQAESGMVKNNALPFVIGKDFSGIIDEVAVYANDLSYFLIEAHSSHMQPTPFCGVGTTNFPDNLYCASDGDWTPDLDIKDKASCVAADFGWTGHYCCSEDDDENEYYSDYDAEPAPFNYSGLVGKATPAANPTKIELDNNFDKVTILGPAKFKYNIYSQKKRLGGGFMKCPGGLIENHTVELRSGQSRTFKLKQPVEGIPTDDCKYRMMTIDSLGTKSGGGCWNKKVIPAGDLVDQHVLNFKGTFYGCGLTQNNPFISLIDSRTGSTLFDASTLKAPDCNIMLYARLGDDKPHAVCTPSGVWKFVADPDATQNASIGWDITEYNVSDATQIGCCRPDQCWSGFECIDAGEYHAVDGDSYFCEE